MSDTLIFEFENLRRSKNKYLRYLDKMKRFRWTTDHPHVAVSNSFWPSNAEWSHCVRRSFYCSGTIQAKTYATQHVCVTFVEWSGHCVSKSRDPRNVEV